MVPTVRRQLPGQLMQLAAMLLGVGRLLQHDSRGTLLSTTSQLSRLVDTLVREYKLAQLADDRYNADQRIVHGRETWRDRAGLIAFLARFSVDDVDRLDLAHDRMTELQHCLIGLRASDDMNRS